MPAKDIISLREFQVDDADQAPELYPRAFALPEFFSHNFVHDSRIVKLFTGENALLKAFYFNYMKLALESNESADYIALLKDKFVSFDMIQEGQLEDKFLSDFQYRKLFKDFVDIVFNDPSLDFQTTANKYPIIDRILQKLFKAVVPIGLFFSQNDEGRTSEFEVAYQVLCYLSQEFEQEFEIETPGKCINFVPTDMHMYFENLNEIYLTYVEDYEDQTDEKINQLRESANSSFVCGEGNSFTSKFKSRRNTTKHPFRKADLATVPNNAGSASGSNQFKESSSSYMSQNLSKESKQSEKQIEFDENQENKSKLLEKNSSLIRRRTKKMSQNQEKKDFLEPKFCYPNQGENGNYSLAYSAIKSDNNQEDDKEKANTLINILDSRVTESNSGLSNSLEKGNDKFAVIVRRNIKKSNSMFESARKEDDQVKEIKPATVQQETFLTDSTKRLLKLQNNDYAAPINLPEPQYKQDASSVKFSQIVDSIPVTNQNSSSNVNQNTGATSHFTFKTTVVNMQEIQELGEDEDTENQIQEFCEVEFANPSMSEKTVNLSENVSHKLTIGIIESRDYNMSKTSLGHGITPQKREVNLSFFRDKTPVSPDSSSVNSSVSESASSLSMSRSMSNTEEIKESFHQIIEPLELESFNVETPKVDSPKIETPKAETPKIESSRHFSAMLETPKFELPKMEEKKRTFEEFMREMKEKIPLSEKPKNQIDFKLTSQRSRFSKPQKPTVKEIFQAETPQSVLIERENSSKKQSEVVIEHTKAKLESQIKLEHSIKLEPEKGPSIIKTGKESDQKIVENHSSWMPNASDEFTKSDILILLDEEYRSKIRAIKKDYKSTISGDPSSSYKENLRSGIENPNGSLMKESRSNLQKNDSVISCSKNGQNDSRFNDSKYNDSRFYESKKDSRFEESKKSSKCDESKNGSRFNESKKQSRFEESKKSSRYEESKQNQSRFNESKQNESRFNESRYNQSKHNESRFNESKHNDSRMNESKHNESRCNETKNNESRYGQSRYNESRYNESKHNDSRYNNNESRYNESRISCRDRETSIYVEER